MSGEEVVLPQSVTKQQSIEIYPPIEVTPSIMVLLWQPGVKYQDTLMVMLYNLCNNGDLCNNGVCRIL